MAYLFSIAALVLALDQLTKWLVLSSMMLGASYPVLAEYFELTLVTNSAAAFNLFHQLPEGVRRPFLSGVMLLSCFFIVYYYRQQRPSELLTRTALALVLGGALGNLVDRIWRGAVVDFLDFGLGAWRWPAFNFADSCICIGVGLVIFAKLGEEKAKA